MPNPIKYTTGTETLALKKGNFYIGTGDVGKGPSDTTGFYQGVSPSAGGYVIYMNKSGAPGDLSYHNAANDSELISFTNNLAGQSYTTVQECLVYYAGQTDKVVLNRDYEGIVTDGLVVNLDAGFTPSYPKDGTTWYDVSSSGTNGVLINGPTFNSNNGGIITFDGTDDYVNIPNNSVSYETSYITVESFVKPVVDYAQYGMSILIQGTNCVQCSFSLLYGRENQKFSWFASDSITLSTTNLPSNNWYHVVGVRRNGGVDLYVNGVLNTTTTNSGVGSGSSTALSIGESINCGVVPNWNGDIGVVRLYNRALSATEVLQNYNATKGRFGL